MTLLKKIAAGLLCSAAPAVLMAQAVELRSSDGFISVEGEITNFNGVMVAIQTTVGLVSVPAAEVVCYGEGCAEVLANNSFGLTEADFAGVVSVLEQPVVTISDDLTLAADSATLENLYRTLAAAFAENSQTTLTADLADDGQLTLENADGSETAVLRLVPATDAADITLAALPLNGQAEAAYRGPRDWALDPTPSHQMLALRAFAVVAAPDLGVDAITLDQLAAIYAGEITNWAELGGADQPVIPLQMPATSDLRRDLVDIVMAPADKSIAENVLTLGDEASIVSTISDIAGSISLVNLANAGDAAVLPVAGSCGLGVSPGAFSIASGDYPLIRPKMAAFARDPQTGLVPALFDYAATDEAQSLLGEEGLVDSALDRQSEAEKSARLAQLLAPGLDAAERAIAAQMFQTLFEAERLTPTMFGGEVSGVEAGWNRAMIQRLAAILLLPEFTGREVIFVGFGTSDAGAQDAIDQSTRAAQDLLEAFNAFAPAIASGNDLTLTATGFGALAHATCIGGQVAGPAQTRIEIWLK